MGTRSATSHRARGSQNAEPAGVQARSATQAMFERVAQRLLAEHADDEPGSMLRSTGVETAGAFYAFPTRDDVVVRLPATRVVELIDEGVGRPCDPHGGRPRRQWVRLRPTDDEACADHLHEARRFVAAEAAR